MDEIWKDIVGYEGLYQVSNMGRVRSKERIFESKGTGRYKRNAQILSLGKHSKGYLTVTLFKNGKYKRFLIHRLVAKSFLPRDIFKNQVNHIDGNKTNNNISNIEWCDSSENQIHRRDILKKKFAPGKPVIQIDNKGNNIREFESISQAAKSTGIKSQNISCVCQGKNRQAGGFRWEFIKNK